MATLDQAVQEFLAQKSIAVVGVSDRRENGCNANYRKFKENGYRVYAVNPRMSSYDGDPCYHNLQSIPEQPDAVFLFTNPTVTEEIVRQCVALGIRHVWMHCQWGVQPGLDPNMTSVSAAGIELCHANGIEVIPGTCPAQFLQPDFSHKLTRFLAGISRNLTLD